MRTHNKQGYGYSQKQVKHSPCYIATMELANIHLARIYLMTGCWNRRVGPRMKETSGAGRFKESKPMSLLEVLKLLSLVYQAFCLLKGSVIFSSLDLNYSV